MNLLEMKKRIGKYINVIQAFLYRNSLLNFIVDKSNLIGKMSCRYNDWIWFFVANIDSYIRAISDTCTIFSFF
jgi:hypothetical protein